MTKQQPPSPARPRLTKTEMIALLLLPLFLLVLIGAVNFPNEFHLQRLAAVSASAFTGFVTAVNSGAVSVDRTAIFPAPSPPAFRLLMGVFTIADRIEERARLRLVRELQPPVAAHIDVKFVLCNLTREEQRVLIALEIMRYDDIMILNCWENVNSGKTYTFFSSLPAMLINGTRSGGNIKPYDFVMKTDDDTYFRFPELVESLRRQPREDVYWGHVHEAGENNPLFMRGMGYVLSWDLVEWIATADVTRNNTVGAEDTLVGAWLRDGGKGKNVYSTRGKNYNFDDTKPVQYDLPWPGSQYTWVPNTISVHRLKDRQKWAAALSYFNVTAGLRPSNLYHLD